MTTGVGNEKAVANAVRRAAVGAGQLTSAASIRLAGRVLGVVAELALTQIGVPGALACCGYLDHWWRTSTRRTARRQGGASRPGPVAAAPAAVRDRDGD
jgi:hypothetical protein